MANDDSTERLLTQIRDSLIVVAEALRPQYEVAVIERLGDVAEGLAALVNSNRQWDALLLMDGTRIRRDISRESGMDQADVGKFVRRLADAGFVRDLDGKPAAVFTVAEMTAIRRTHG